MTYPALRRSGKHLAALAVSAAAVGLPAGAVAQTPSAAEATGQAVVTLSADRVARTRPRTSARPLATIASRRPITGVPTVLPVLSSKVDPNGLTWLYVRMPGRPNGRKGWITTIDTTLSSAPWRIVVHLGARTVKVYSGRQLIRRFRAVVGAPTTPTPRGQFFVEEAVALGSGAEGGPFALATSARSAVLQEFNGGPGQIALHGMHGLTGAPGTATSHGCVRLSTAAVTWLAGHIGAGTPITVR